MPNADNQLRGARNLGVLRSSIINRADQVGRTDQDDLYRFSLNRRSRLNVTLTQSGSGGAAVELYALKRPLDQVLRQIGRLDFRKISRKDLIANLRLISAPQQGSQNPGSYFIRVLRRASSSTGNSRYRLQLAATTRVDAKAPTAKLSRTNLSIGGGSRYDFTVIYRDNVAIQTASINNADIRVTGPNGFNQLARRVAVSDRRDGTPRSVTYRITAPGGSWDGTDNGSYSIALQANQISDSSGNFAAAKRLGSFQVTISQAAADREAPTADLLAINPSTRDLTVVYRDNLAFNAASIDDNDIRVISPNGLQLITRVIANQGSGSTRTVTYRLTPPGGGWDNADNGSYSIALQANQISDSRGNFAAAKSLGTLNVNIPPRTGNGYSITGSDETNIAAQFKLFATLPDGSPIADQATSSTVGLFTAAIEEFASGSGRLENLLDSKVRFFNRDNQVTAPVLNLRAELINYDPVAKTGTLEYRFFQKNVNEFQPGVDETLFGLRFTLNADFVNSFNLDQAVNSLAYIVANNLFGDGTGANKPSGLGFSENSTLNSRDITGGTVLTSN